VKIKIVFYSHTIDYAGTWRSHEQILLNLNKNIFQPYVLYNQNVNHNRLNFVIENLGNEYVIPFSASTEKTGPDLGYSFISTNFEEKLLDINPDIIHYARSGYYEWPFTKKLSPIQIETNIFGFKDSTPFLDYSIAISNTIKNIRGGANEVIYNPIPKPINNNENLKKELNISENTFVLGRIGRPDNFTPISIECAKIMKESKIDFKYIIIGACNLIKNKIKELDLEDFFILLDTTNDDNLIHKFYNTIDVFAHYRSDGETFGVSIAQSMTYGKPVVSHIAGSNGQSEIIGDSGFVVKNSMEYFLSILKLIKDKNLYKNLSDLSIKNSEQFQIQNIIPKIESTYLSLLKK
jgi:glycosyltransferase involved in cell wall biosynthesis